MTHSLDEHTNDDLDSLIGRLQTVARQLDDTPQVEPPPFAYRRLLNSLGEPRENAQALRDARHPELAELVAPGLDDQRFLTRAYHVLMGRTPDDEGWNAYLAELPRAGRLYVLGDMLRAEETRTHLERHAIDVPRRRRLTAPLNGLYKLGPAARLVRPVMRLAYRLVAIAGRPGWRQGERLARLEADNARRDALLRDVLLEIDGELQRQNEGVERLKRENDARREESEQHQAALEAWRQQSAGLWSALQHHRRAVERLYAEPEAAPAPSAERAETLDQALIDAYYLAFEDACRGSEAEIRAHLLAYQPQLDRAVQCGTRALDVGCGRGEWLRLLDEQGFDAHGVDLNIAMVEHCRAAGFTVSHDDAVNVLRQQPDDSHALVSAFHIAEHLPFEVLYRLVDEAHRALAPGGVLILETPNPENLLVGSHTFYHDPTHRNPLTPTAMSFLLRYCGFDVEVRRFNPYPESAKVPGDDPLTERVNGHLCGPQDFAVVGVKAVATDASSTPPAEEQSPRATEEDDTHVSHVQEDKT